MNFQNVFKRVCAAGIAAATVFSVSAAAQLQQSEAAESPTLVVGSAARGRRVAERSDLYCAGYVQTAPVDTSSKIVGAVEEQEQFNFSLNNFIYINAGANKGVKVGDLLSVIRPRGAVKTKWTRKDDLGFYVQEVGALEVIKVKPDVSVARVRSSCDAIQLGDLVQPTMERTSPIYARRPALDLFTEPSGRATGRLFMARGNVEMPTRDQIVYVDLGSEDSIQVGDYLTIYRPLGKGNIVRGNMDIHTEARNSGFQSDEYRGGQFSILAARKSGAKANGSVVTSGDARKDRPDNLRKVVGEAVVLNVKERTATAIITRTAQEIHTGDWVELQ